MALSKKPFWHLLNDHLRLAGWTGDGSKRQCSWINVHKWIEEMCSGWCSYMTPDNLLEMNYLVLSHLIFKLCDAWIENEDIENSPI